LSRRDAVGVLLAAVGSSLWLVLAPAAAAPRDGPIVNPDAVVDPRAAPISPPADDPGGTGTTTTGGTTGTTGPTGPTGPGGTGTPGTGGPDPASGAGDVTQRSPAFGNAAIRSNKEKVEEAAGDCGDSRPPNSKMLAIGGVLPRDEGGSFGWLALTIAGCAAALALAAFLIRRGKPGERSATPGPLEVTATVVAIFGGLAGLAVQFIPGVGVNEPVPTEASMEVREVHARITRGEYARKTGADVNGIPEIDRREVGDVIWLEIGLKGYRDRQPRLQYALYNPDRAGTLLPATEQIVELRVQDSDAQTLVVPVWVGFPRSDHFQAKFRLLDGEVVRQIAATRALSSSPFRYACEKDI
jgi:hypothetical protein